MNKGWDTNTLADGCSFHLHSYLNYLVERDRRFIMDTLVNGLSRLEYRGYDSAGKWEANRERA